APSPEAFFGYAMGAGPRLPSWDRTVEYLRTLARASPRVRVDEVGKTTGGRPYLLVTISTPDTLKALPEARAAQRRLADPLVTTGADAERIAREHKAIVLIGAGVHSNETGSAQAINELVWRLATERSPAIDHLLRSLIVLVVPSQNPDGLQMMAEWQARNAGTSYEDAPLPELYHPYAGHDNNRDSFMQTQVETRYLSTLLYRDWLPEVYLDLHQMGPTRARIFVPPYRSPANPNIDPLVWSQANLLGQTMATRLQAEGKTGVLWGETYSGYWQGANSTTPWWHNIIGMLSEVASARPTSAVVHEAADVQFRMNYPEPWLGGRWTPRDVVEYHLLAALGLLEGVANNRVMLKRNFHAMQRRTIERFTTGGPWAFAVPVAQHDRGAADHLLHLLRAGGAHVEVVTGRGGGSLAPGDAVIRLAQPVGRWVKDLLEPQVYPEPRATVDRPYDVTAWTLGLQMGVTVNRLDTRVTVSLARLEEGARRAGRIIGSGPAIAISREANAAATLINRLWAKGATIGWTRSPLRLLEAVLPAATAVASGLPPAVMEHEVAASGLDVLAVSDEMTTDLAPARRPRVAVIEPWGGAIDAGWTRWVLEQHAFEYTRIRPADLQDRAVAARFDAIVIPEVPSLQLLRGLQGSQIRPEHRGGIEDRGVATLKHFVRAGGTVITLGNAAEFAIDHLDLPAVVASRADDPDTALVPGTLLKTTLAPDHPVNAGMTPRVDVMNVMNNAYAPGRGAEGLRAIAQYPDEPLVASGYASGESRLRGRLAAFDVAMGRGRVVVLGFRAQHRAQTWATFKMLFNAIFLAGSGSPTSDPQTIDN
ncbi:MAG: hypothetical protein JJE40_03845, partial [Vicinamibacteria bacterium]|nr:hypothetical protein [Vicinamibacteria bacterium]